MEMLYDLQDGSHIMTPSLDPVCCIYYSRKRERQVFLSLSSLSPGLLKSKSIDIISLPQTWQLRTATENGLAKVPLWLMQPRDLYSDRGSLF